MFATKPWVCRRDDSIKKPRTRLVERCDNPRWLAGLPRNRSQNPRAMGSQVAPATQIRGLSSRLSARPAATPWVSSQIESPRGGRVGYHVGLIVQRLTGRGFSSRSRERRSRLSGLSHRFEPKSRAAVGYHLDKRRSKPHIAARTTAWANRKAIVLEAWVSHRPLSRRRRGRIEPNVSPVPV